MIDVKPSERPPVIRYVIRNKEGFYYDGHGQAEEAAMNPDVQSGVPHFFTKSILFAIKYGDIASIEALIKNHKKWCIDHDKPDLFGLFDTCEFLETYT